MLLVPPDSRPEEISNTCDWGNCNGLTTTWRWGGPALMTWLPVCHEHREKTHAERVSELAKEFRRLAAEQRVKSTNDRYAPISQFKAEEAAMTWEQAAHMLETAFRDGRMDT